MNVVLIIAAPLVLHLLFRSVPDHERRLPRLVEVLFALLAAFGGAWLLAVGLYDAHVQGGVYTSSDFEEYCSIVGRLRVDDWPEQSQRSLLAGWPSAQLAEKYGLLNGMAGMGLVCAGVSSLGLYVWGRALQGPVAGFAAVLISAAFAPTVLLSHDLSFYPESVATFCLGAGACASALRWRHWSTQALLGVAIGACLLVDAKGLIWALAFAGLGLLAALSSWRRIAYRLPALLLPIALSYPLGELAYPPLASSMEDQADLSKRMQEYGYTFDDSHIRWDSHYVWGRSNPLEIPYTLHTVWAIGQGVHPEYSSGPVVDQRWSWRVGGLAPLGAAAGVALVVLCVRRRDGWMVLGLLGTAVPFAAALESALSIHMAFPRHLATGLPWFAVWGGVAWSAALDGWPRTEVVRDLRLRPVLGVGLLGVLVWGAVPSDLSPSAAWRHRLDAENQDIRRLAPLTVPQSPRSRERDCVQAFQADRRADLDARGTLYGGIAHDPTRSD